MLWFQLQECRFAAAYCPHFQCITRPGILQPERLFATRDPQNEATGDKRRPRSHTYRSEEIACWKEQPICQVGFLLAQCREYET